MKCIYLCNIDIWELHLRVNHFSETVREGADPGHVQGRGTGSVKHAGVEAAVGREVGVTVRVGGGLGAGAGRGTVPAGKINGLP